MICVCLLLIVPTAQGHRELMADSKLLIGVNLSTNGCLCLKGQRTDGEILLRHVCVGFRVTKLVYIV